MKITKEQSEKQAGVILDVLFALIPLDIPYIRHFATVLNQDASKYNAMAVLNRNWKQSKHDLMVAQAKAANLLCDYKETLQRIDELKKEVQEEDERNQFMDKLFGI